MSALGAGTGTKVDWHAVAGAFACVALITLPFAHSVAIRSIALGAAWLATLAAWRRLDVPRVPLLWLFALWGGLGLLSLTWAVDLQYSAAELKTEVLYSFLVFLLFFALSDEVWIERFRRTLMIATVLSLASAVYWLMFVGAGKTGGFYNGPGMYSTYLIGVYPFALVWLLDSNAGSRARWGHAAVLLVILCGGAITENRMLWIVLALQTAIVLAFHARRVPVVKAAVTAAVATTLFAGLLYGISSKRFNVDPVSPDAVGATMAGDIRLQMWARAADRIVQEPFNGAGFGRGSLREDFRTEFGSGLYWHAHNVVLNYGLSMGVAGVVLILLLFGVVAWRLWSAWRTHDAVLAPYALAGIAMVVGMFLKNVTDDLFVRQSALLYWSLAGMIFGAYARRERQA